MLEKWKGGIRRLSPAAKRTVANAYGIKSTKHLFEELSQRRVMQADVAVHLLRAGLRSEVERLTGVRVRRMMPAVPPAEPRPVRAKPRTGGQRRFVHVAPNPHQRETDAKRRYSLFRVGRTVDKYKALGGRQRDLREALHAGWVKLEE